MKVLYSTFLISLLIAPFLGSAEDLTLLGGDTTTTLPKHAALQVPSPNLVNATKRQQQLDGFSVFHRRSRVVDGLGPQFVHNGCGSCHLDNGKGRVKIDPTGEKPSTMVIKVSIRGLQESGAPTDVPGFGEQLKVQIVGSDGKQNRVRKKLYRKLPRLKWKKVFGEYADGAKYALRKPRLLFRLRGYKKSEIVSSLRMASGLVGVGLLEGIPESQILAWSDEADSNNDGISGKPNYVPDRRTGTMQIGRFGFRGSHTTVEQQSAAAAFHDIGLTNVLFTDDKDAISTDLSDEDLEILTIYQQLPGVPAARDQDSPNVIAGQDIFKQIGCDDCHKMTVVTEHSEHSELDGQTIHPFTDLLMHDMGEGLADERDEFSATGSEWKTTPLWGIGHLSTVRKKSKKRYLHDGRARSIEEAILWHGGEAAKAQGAFKELLLGERQALIRFLESL